MPRNIKKNKNNFQQENYKDLSQEELRELELIEMNKILLLSKSGEDEDGKKRNTIFEKIDRVNDPCSSDDILMLILNNLDCFPEESFKEKILSYFSKEKFSNYHSSIFYFLIKKANFFNKKKFVETLSGVVTSSLCHEDLAFIIADYLITSFDIKKDPIEYYYLAFSIINTFNCDNKKYYLLEKLNFTELYSEQLRRFAFSLINSIQNETRKLELLLKISMDQLAFSKYYENIHLKNISFLEADDYITYHDGLFNQQVLNAHNEYKKVAKSFRKAALDLACSKEMLHNDKEFYEELKTQKEEKTKEFSEIMRTHGDFLAPEIEERFTAKLNLIESKLRGAEKDIENSQIAVEKLNQKYTDFQKKYVEFMKLECLNTISNMLSKIKIDSKGKERALSNMVGCFNLSKLEKNDDFIKYYAMLFRKIANCKKDPEQSPYVVDCFAKIHNSLKALPEEIGDKIVYMTARQEPKDKFQYEICNIGYIVQIVMDELKTKTTITKNIGKVAEKGENILEIQHRAHGDGESPERLHSYIYQYK